MSKDDLLPSYDWDPWYEWANYQQDIADGKIGSYDTMVPSAGAAASSSSSSSSSKQPRVPLTDEERRKAIEVVSNQHFGGTTSMHRKAYEAAKAKYNAGQAKVQEAQALKNQWMNKYMDSDDFGDTNDQLYKDFMAMHSEGSKAKDAAAREKRAAQSKGAHSEELWAGFRQRVDAEHDPYTWPYFKKK